MTRGQKDVLSRLRNGHLLIKKPNGTYYLENDGQARAAVQARTAEALMPFIEQRGLRFGNPIYRALGKPSPVSENEVQ